MILTRLTLEEFRSYRDLTLEVPATGLRLYGRNAGGKSTLLEAVYMLATTRSPRASLERELINWSSNQEFGLAPFARLAGSVHTAEADHQIELTVELDANGAGTTRKRVKLDGRGRRGIDVVGTLKVVLFQPEDLDLVLGPPLTRRRYLDITISQLDRRYLQSLSRYGRLIEQRNSLLKSLVSRGSSRSAGEELDYWDAELTRYASYIITVRLAYLQGVERWASEAFEGLAGEGARLGLRYRSALDLPETLQERVGTGSIEDGQRLIARAFEAGLAGGRAEELRRGVTLIGPHRDDVALLLDGRDLSAFGSRGQQRLGVVALKLAELRQVIELSGERPVLLLDDVLSELDPTHQSQVLDTLAQSDCQTLVTSADPASLTRESLSHLPLMEVASGRVVPASG